MFDEDVNMNLNEEKDSLVINLNEVDENESDFSPIPKGTYQAQIENVTFSYSKSSGNPMLTWTFRVTEKEYENRMLFLYTVLTVDFHVKMIAKIIKRVLPDYDASQFKPKEFVEMGTALGRNCRVKVKIETSEYQGKKRDQNKVTDILADNNGMGFMDDTSF